MPNLLLTIIILTTDSLHANDLSVLVLHASTTIVNSIMLWCVVIGRASRESFSFAIPEQLTNRHLSSSVLLSRLSILRNGFYFLY